jgi:hypothetical protein
MMEEIAGLSMDMAATELAVSYSTAVTKKVMDTQELAGQGLQEMLQAVPTPGEGEYIDVYA